MSFDDDEMQEYMQQQLMKQIYNGTGTVSNFGFNIIQNQDWKYFKFISFLLIAWLRNFKFEYFTFEK